jgi:hypothetical protein
VSPRWIATGERFAWQAHTVIASCLLLKRSKFQACAEVDAVTRDAIADIEVVDPARTEIEVALTQLGGVGNDRADAECAPEKAVERSRCAFVVDLLDPTLDKANAQAVLESFDRTTRGRLPTSHDAVWPCCYGQRR